jgi:hypothetical protein
MLLFMLYDFDCCLGSFPNDYKLLYFCYLAFTDGTCLFHWVFNEDFGTYGGFYIFWRRYRGWVFSYAITEELHAPVFTPE